MSEPAHSSETQGGARRLVASLDRTLGALSGGFLRFEDAALLGWLVLGAPLGRALAGANGPNAGDPLGTDPDALSGLIWLAATVLAIAVVATRSPGDPVIGFEDISTPRSYAPLPFLLSVSIVSHTAMGRLGVETEVLTGIVFIATMVSYVAYPNLPNLPRTVRRLMILPFVLIAGTVFGEMVADVSDLFDLRALLADPAATPAAFAGVLGLQVLFSGFFFLAFVLAPRMVAEAEGTWRAWLVRYLLFLVATIVSVSFLGGGRG
ncbi:MAG: hypothetical protein M3P84_10485 [Chloroflexota bacterium]|nr:hypothetical protein [Chloroflexota bacterium]